MKTLDQVAEFHGHTCPGLAFGYRAAACAMGALGAPSADEEIVAIVENDSCAVDAVQVLTGCTFGKGNLVFRDYGKQVYTFIKRATGQTIRLAVRWEPPPESPEDVAAWERYRKGDRAPDVLRVVHERKSRKIQAIMSATDDELFAVSDDPVDPPPTARIHPSVRCERCGEKFMEPRGRLLAGSIVCLPCFERAQYRQDSR